jgi:S-adenosylmethionine-dependent methyltransferase
MTVSPATFDSSMDRWIEEQRSPWSQLKYTVVHANLKRHLGDNPLRILDAGGGNGADTIPLAVLGHAVVLVDYSTEMLADATRRIAAVKVRDRVTMYHADLAMVPALLPNQSFDMVLCHNVVQYVDDALSLLAGLAIPLKPGGIISVMGVNRYSVPYHAAFLRNNLDDAFAALEQHRGCATLFKERVRFYTGEEIAAFLSQAGCAVDGHYGIRCLCDYWGDNERKSNPDTFAQIERLELALTDRHPYNLLARYFQVVAHKLECV